MIAGHVGQSELPHLLEFGLPVLACLLVAVIAGRWLFPR